MNYKVNATTVFLTDILSSTNKYKIPYNQRPYVWDSNNWQMLWDSFFSESETSDFLGSVIFLNEKEGKQKVMQIFDGQQRITTLTILCKSVVDYLHENENFSDEAAVLTNYIIDARRNPRLIVNSKIEKYFKKNIQDKDGGKVKPEEGGNEWEKNIKKCYDFFYSEIIKYVKKEKEKNSNYDSSNFYEAFIERFDEVELVRMLIDDILLGIEIFESVNHKGETLNASELVKNILIKYGDIEKQNLFKMDEKWNEIGERILQTNFQFIDFMHYYWLSVYGYVSKKNLFTEMKKKLGNKSSSWLGLFSELDDTSQSFKEIIVSPNHVSFRNEFPYFSNKPNEYNAIIQILNAFKCVNNKSWILPVFTLLDYERKINKSKGTFIGMNSKSNFRFKYFLKKHFVFTFLHFNIFKYPTRDYTPAMLKLCELIHNAYDSNPNNSTESNKSVLEAFMLHFRGGKKDKKSYDFIPNTVKRFKEESRRFDEGINEFRHKPDNKYLIHYLYAEIEKEIYKGTHHQFESYSVEHYMPQKSDTWNISKSVSKKHENKLGNILIIDATLNGILQNKPHNEKFDFLLKSKKNTNMIDDFIKTHQDPAGAYSFSRLTEKNLKDSDYFDKPSEIDKRTRVIGSQIREIYLNKFDY